MSKTSKTASDLEATSQLLVLARDGDDEARNRLAQRFLPILRRWAHGRLPASARDLAETADLVQLTLMRALQNIDRFESRGEGAFLAYLRQILLNAVRDEVRRVTRRPGHDGLSEIVSSREPSALEKALGRERMERYEAGLEQLEDRQRQAVVLRFEFGYSFSRIAEAIDAPTANAARMVVSRAVTALAELLDA